ncbi:MAG TPA: nicotinate-nucleotide adenylyltransferase [Planctomycetota bacterium]|nr:nicotinate-nucleotide adenylyltransferase [Planctomycetota bacterium]
MKIGVLGGTFNPVHIGHLILAEQVRCAARLEKVLFVPAHCPPHKATDEMAPDEHRLHMVQLAVAGNPYFVVSEIELKRKGTSYTYDTMRLLCEENPGDEFHFIVGGDTVPELPSWHRITDLLDICDFLIGDRPGHLVRWEALEAALPSAQVSKLRKGVVYTVPVGVASSDIRHRIRHNHTIRYLVPAKVEEYLTEHGLYK